MVKIELISLSIKNFKGIKEKTIEFTPTKNIISGPSGIGKTTIAQSYLWALGFMSSKWEPLPLEIGKSTEVECVVKKNDNTELKFKKINIPNVNYENNAQENKFSYYIDDRLVTATQYKEILCSFYELDYLSLELLSNIALFNSEKGEHWNFNKRRLFLFALFKENKNCNDLIENPRFEKIKDLILNKTENEIKTFLNDAEKQIAKQQTINLKLIEEKEKNIENLEQINFRNLEEEDIRVNTRIKEIKSRIQNSKQMGCPNCKAKIEIGMTITEDAMKELEKLRTRQFEIKTQLLKLNTIEDLKSQIIELKKDSKQKEIEKVGILEQKDILEEFIYQKSQLLEKTINNEFKDINFIFFKQNYSMNKNADLSCIASYNDIDYSSLSEGEKIEVDFKINNILQDIFSIFVPVFVDNISSNALLKSTILDKNYLCESQKIFLINENEV